MANIENIVKVMNFHALLRVDKSKKYAEKFFGFEQQLNKVMCEIYFNKNLKFDKKISFEKEDGDIVNFYMEMTCTDADIFMESVSEKGGTQPAGYTRLLGEGRLCALTPGHTLDVWENEQFMRMFTNAMEWCLKER